MFVYLFAGVFIIGNILLALVYNVSSNKKKDVFRVILFSICNMTLWGLGSYIDIASDYHKRVGENYLIPCLLYSIVILVSLSVFYSHKRTDEKKIIKVYFGDFTPSIPLLRNTAYIFIIYFILESFFRLINRNSLLQCFWTFFYYVPSTFEEELKFRPSNECSYFILIFSSICLLCMLYSDWRYNKKDCIRSLRIAVFSLILIFVPINIYRYYYYFIPTNYNVDNGILRNCDIELLGDHISDNVSVDAISSLGNITLGEACQKVDREIQNYINSIENDGIAYIFDNETYIRSISCIFDDNKLQVIAFRIENNRFNEGFVLSQFDRKFVANRDYALEKKDEFVILEFNHDLARNGHPIYDYLHITQPYESKYWDSAIATISKKYGSPMFVGTELNDAFTFEGNRTYYWITDYKIIKFHIYRDSVACLSYIKSSFIMDIKHDREQKEKEEIELYNNMIIEEEQNRLQDSIEKVTKEKKNEHNNREISNKTFEDI